MVIGILALQGAVAPHQKHLNRLGITSREIRLPKDLEGIQGLILPGGESTTMLRLAQEFSLWEPLKNKAKEIPFWGICAGSILMADKVENPVQDSLKVFPVSVRRNGYGRQLDSFSQKIILKDHSEKEAVFIRAPKFLSWGKNVDTLATINGEAVFLSYGKHMITAFHPELIDDSWAHELFLSLCN